MQLEWKELGGAWPLALQHMRQRPVQHVCYGCRALHAVDLQHNATHIVCPSAFARLSHRFLLYVLNVDMSMIKLGVIKN